MSLKYMQTDLIINADARSCVEQNKLIHVS